MTALEKFREVSRLLKSFGIEDAPKEAELLITSILGITKTSLYSGKYEITEEDSKKIDSLTIRRIRREPLQYILGYVEFLGLKFNLGKGVLIPRPETEILAQEAIKTLKNKNGYVLDLCTGSGCIAITIAKNFPEAIVFGIDISEDALRYAEENARLNNTKNIQFLKGDLFEPLRLMSPKIRFDLIVSNPPYIKSEDIKSLQPEIRNWEPLEALNGGPDGLYYYRRIISELRDFLAEAGTVLVELGDSNKVMEIAKANNFKVLSITKDLSGIDRVMHLVLNHS